MDIGTEAVLTLCRVTVDAPVDVRVDDARVDDARVDVTLGLPLFYL